MNRTITALCAILGASVIVLSGCALDPAESDERISIVASTDVYASIASAVAGDRAEVTAIIDNPATDPHSYEASARDRLALTRADIVVSNGGGYDPFIGALLADDPAQTVLVAVELSGFRQEAEHEHEHDDGDNQGSDGAEHGHRHGTGLNEHVWYRLATAKNVAASIAESLTDRDPEAASLYAANAARFVAAVNVLIDRALEIERVRGHSHVVMTEPAPQYLVELVGARNVTPEPFTSAVEAGFDVPASTLLEVLRLVEGREVDLVVWNEQTSGPQLERVAAAARDAGVPVVSVTETLPAGVDYVEWMSANLDALEEALTR